MAAAAVKRRPLVGITGPSRGALAPRWLVALMVRVYGGRPLQLRPGDPLDRGDFDALVVTGGHDVDPVLYAAEPEVEARHDRERDAFESAAIHHALERKLPILGICRGAQLLNVCLGGSLHQSLHAHRRTTSARWTILPLKTLQVTADSRLQRILLVERCRINNLHNQAIDRLGDGLYVSGRDLDGIVQAVEGPGPGLLLGVQWHPEFLVYSRRQRRLFHALLGAARA